MVSCATLRLETAEMIVGVMSLQSDIKILRQGFFAHTVIELLAAHWFSPLHGFLDNRVDIHKQPDLLRGDRQLRACQAGNDDRKCDIVPRPERPKLSPSGLTVRQIWS